MIKRVFAVAALSCALPAFAAISEVESNGSIPTAQVLALTGSGSVSITGAIKSPIYGKADYDFYNLGHFTLGGNIKVRVSGGTSLLDPAIAIYNSKGLLVVNDDERWPEFGTQSYLDYFTLADDSYFLAIFSAKGSSALEAVSSDPFSATPGNKAVTQGAYTANLTYNTGFVPPPQGSVKPAPKVTAVPEPSGIALSGLGLLALLGMRRNRRAA